MWTLITGAGSGIGRALAIELAGHGRSLILAGRTGSKLEQVAAEIQRANSVSDVMTVVVDFADPGSTRALADRVRNDAGRLSAFIHCAGVGEPAADFASLELVDFQESLAVNVSAPMLLTQGLLPVLQGSDPASRIVMIGAGLDQRPQPGTGSYGIAKMALRRLVQQLTVEFDTMDHGPIASLFQPGLVDTPGIRQHVAKASGLGLPHAQWLQERLQAGECLTAEQCASALAYTLLQTPESEFRDAVFHGPDLVDSLSFAGS